MREVGAILCSDLGGSFQGFIETFQRRYDNDSAALQLVQMVTDMFPSFRDAFVRRTPRSNLKEYLRHMVSPMLCSLWIACPTSGSTANHSRSVLMLSLLLHSR